MQSNLNIDVRGGRAVKGGRHALTGRPTLLSGRQTKAIGALSRYLQDDIGVVQAPLDNVPRLANREWWRWPALGTFRR